MSEWQQTTLGSILSLEYGKSLPERDREGRGAPVLGSNGVVGFHSSPIVEGPGVVVGRKGTAGSVTYVHDDFFPIDTTYFVQLVRHDIDMTFVCLLLEHADLPSLTAQTGVPGLNRDRAYAVSVAVPALAEQRRIVEVMAGVDALVTSLTEEVARANQTYKSASSLLWLDASGVDFPCRPLGEVMQLNLERVRLDPEGTYAIAGVLGSGLGVIDKGTFLGRDTRYAAMNVLRADQVVMRKLTAWEGPITVVPPSFDGYVASNEFPTFRLGADIDPAWMRHVCRTSRLWAEMKNRVTGSVQRRKRLSPEQLLSVSLPIPPRQVQERVATGLDAIDEQAVVLSHELAALRTVRSRLLTSLLNQETKIPKSYEGSLEKVS